MGQLLTDALVIKNETLSAKNTANRVGGWMEDAAEAIETLPSALNFFDFSSASVTTANQNTWTPFVCSVTTGFQRNGISTNGSGLMTYVGENKTFQFSFIAALLESSARKIHVAMFKNGQLWPCSEFAQTIAVQGNEVSIPSQCVIPLQSGDVVQVYIKCSTHALSATLDNLNVIIKEF
jgi:hypothetical protein